MTMVESSLDGYKTLWEKEKLLVTVFTCLQYNSFENTVGKGEIARNEQFLLFPHCFPPFIENFLAVSSNSKLLSENSFSLEESKICRLGTVYMCHFRNF